MTRRTSPAVLVAAALFFVGCGDDGEDTEAADQTTTAAPTTSARAEASEPALEGGITVFAAASLTDAYTELGATFQEQNPGIGVELNFGPSSGLATQIVEGAPADVFASANATQMDVVVEAGANEGEPQPFVTNVLQIAVPPDNPGEVAGLDDFARDELLVGLCAEAVPCGQFGRQVLEEAGITAAVDTNEPDVRALLTKVEAGELDAGIVYETDVLASGDAVEGVAIPADQNVVATYPVVALAESGAPEVATALVDFVLSTEGLEILESYGFRAP